MEEPLADLLKSTADVVHWLGHYRTCNALILLSRFVRVRGLDDIEKLEAFVTEEEAKHSDG